MSSGCLRNMFFFLSKSCLSITQVTLNSVEITQAHSVILGVVSCAGPEVGLLMILKGLF